MFSDGKRLCDQCSNEVPNPHTTICSRTMVTLYEFCSESCLANFKETNAVSFSHDRKRDLGKKLNTTLNTIRSVHGHLNVMVGGVVAGRIVTENGKVYIETVQGREGSIFSDEQSALGALESWLGSLTQ